MSVSSLITELKSLETEIKNTSKYLQELKRKKDSVEKSIITFLEVHNLPGFKYEGQIYQPQLSQTYRKKKKGEKVETIKHILENSGAPVDDHIISDVFTVFKSKPIPIQKLRTKAKVN